MSWAEQRKQIVPPGYIGWTAFCLKHGKKLNQHAIARTRLIDRGFGFWNGDIFVVKQDAPWPKMIR